MVMTDGMDVGGEADVRTSKGFSRVEMILKKMCNREGELISDILLIL